MWNRLLICSVLTLLILGFKLPSKPSDATFEQRLIGYWYGASQPNTDGNAEFISYHAEDHTFIVKFRWLEHDEVFTTEERGTWRIEDGLKIVTTTKIDGEEIPPDEQYEDYYKIIKLNDEVCIYQLLGEGNTYTTERVDSSFDFQLVQ